MEFISTTTHRGDFASSLAEDIGKGYISVEDANAILNGNKTYAEVQYAKPEVQQEINDWLDNG